MKSSKEELKELVLFLINAKKFRTQSELSVDAGYAEQGLTQAISKKKGHEAVIDNLKLIYRDLLKNSIWDNNKENNKSITVKEADIGKTLSKLIEAYVRQQSLINTMLKTVEVLSATAAKRSVALISAEMQQAANLEADRLRDEFLNELK